MKVIIVVDNVPARIERLTKIAISLIAAGNEVIIVCPSSVQVLPEYRVLRVPCVNGNPFAHYVTFALGVFFVLFRLPRRIVHYVNHPDFALPAVCAASKLAGHKLVYDRRVDFGAIVASRHSRLASFVRLFEEVGCRCADAITVDAPSRKQRCLKYLSKLEVVPNGVELEKFKIQRSKHRGFVVTCVAALTEVEGVDVFVKAASIVRKLDKSVRFQVVGDGELKAELMRLSKSLGNPVQFLGWIPHNQIPRILSSSDACVSSVLPIGYAHGAYPVKLFEYLASGTPTIASDFRGHLDLVKDEKDVLIYPAYDPIALARQILNLKDHPRLQLRLSRNGLRIAERYSWTICFKRLQEVYLQLARTGHFKR
jgi:glycosyltransferase involved in cell wall biosynthesis